MNENMICNAIIIIILLIEYCVLFKDEIIECILKTKTYLYYVIIIILVYLLLGCLLMFLINYCEYFSSIFINALTIIITIFINERIIKPRNQLKKLKHRLSSCIKTFEWLKEKKLDTNITIQSESQSCKDNSSNNTIYIPLTIYHFLENFDKILSEKSKNTPEMIDKIKNDALNEIKNIAFEIAGLYEVYPILLPKSKIKEIINDFKLLDTFITGNRLNNIIDKLNEINAKIKI